MTKIAVVIKSEPYSDESVYTGLKFVKSALSEGHNVEVFLVQGGVFCALSKQNPKDMPNLYSLLEQLISDGARIVCCGTCVSSRGIDTTMIHPNVEIGSMQIFVEMIASSNSSITF
ncbi:MAG: hypothetical protein GF411_02085 [Candidatus Lokiarchaeota archaeon]|nr:hypothetical protein [Candidatus Lokiarchaeota archaeon]